MKYFLALAIVLLICMPVFAEKETEVTQDMLGVCQEDSDCVIVDYSHCCGSSKKAINKKYLDIYLKHDEWQRFFDEDQCAVIGMCEDDSNVTEAFCGSKQCQLKY